MSNAPLALCVSALACAAVLSTPACRSTGEPAPSATDDAIHVTTRAAKDEGGAAAGGTHPHAVKTVFVVVMENKEWSEIYKSSEAPFINSLLPKASFCTAYYDNPLGVHPSEPNYIWMEAGFHLGLVTDANPSATNVSSEAHLTQLMDASGVAWKTYAEDAPPGVCPIDSTGSYAPKHVPAIFFTDVVGQPPTATSPQCIRHVVPFSALAKDLSDGNVGRYNFIVPNLCNDMHGGRDCPRTSEITHGDEWLSRTVPMITQSKAYADGGALFITWDESEHGEHPIGMIVLSPAAKGGGFASTVRYFHSSLLRTVEEIFDLSPLLNDAARQPDLGDLFRSPP
jgi:hypothetical protein